MLSSRFLLELLGSRIVPMSLLCVCVCSDSFTDAAPPRHFGCLFLCFTASQSMLSASLTLPHGTDLGLVFLFFFFFFLLLLLLVPKSKLKSQYQWLTTASFQSFLLQGNIWKNWTLTLSVRADKNLACTGSGVLLGCNSARFFNFNLNFYF